MIEDGRVFAAVPPLHRVVVMNPGTKPNETIYTYSEAELHALLAKLKKPGKRWQEPDPALQGPRRDGCRPARDDDDGPSAAARCAASRMRDAENAGRVFELLMGNEVAPRKEFIVDSSDALDARAASTPDAHGRRAGPHPLGRADVLVQVEQVARDRGRP